MPKSAVATLLRTTWATVDGMVNRLVAAYLDTDRLDELYRITLARRIRRHHQGIINAITHDLSNSLTEGLNAGIRLIQRRAHGYASLDNLIEMIHLCHGGTTTPLPTETR
jgi:hypothetical protein